MMEIMLKPWANPLNDADVNLAIADGEITRLCNVETKLRADLAAAKERERTNDILLEQQGDKLAALNDDLAAAKAEIYEKDSLIVFLNDHCDTAWDKVDEQEKELAARDLVIKQAKKFIFEWDLARSSGEWPYRVLQELREVLAVSTTEALDEFVQRAVLEEREN